MDFSSALEDLERTADAASSGRGNSDSRGHGPPRGGRGYHSHGPPSNNRRRGRPEDPYNSSRRNQRPRHHHQHHHSAPYGRGGGGGRGGPPRHSYHAHNPLEDMRRLGYRIEEPPVAPPPPEKLGTAERPFHIALLAICIDGLPYEDLWRSWATTDGTSSNTHVSLLVHAKYPHKITSPFLRQRLLVHPPTLGRGNSYADPVFLSHQPQWGSVQITRAMVDLLREALLIGNVKPDDAAEKDPRFTKQRYYIPTTTDKDTATSTTTTLPPVDKFVYISESCVPVATLAEFEKALLGTPDQYANIPSTDPKSNTDSTTTTLTNAPTILPWHVSWVHARNRNSPDTPKNKYERDQFGDIYRTIPGQYRWKADQWCALARPHAAAIANVDAHLRPSDHLWTAYQRISASDEMYIPTALAVLQVIKDPKVVLRQRRQQQQQRRQQLESSAARERSNSQDKPISKEHKDETAQTTPPAETTAATEETKPKATEEEEQLTPESLSPTIRFQSVTYTDWSEGMRNPKSFHRGIHDFRSICKLARQQGSLMARKFILSPPSAEEALPDKPLEELPGFISYDEWKQAMEDAVPLAGV